MLKIEVRHEGDKHPEVKEFRQSRILVGRGTGHDLVLTDPRASRTPFVIELKPDGGFVVTVNGEKKEANQSLRFRHGPYQFEIEDLRLINDEKTGEAKATLSESRDWRRFSATLLFLLVAATVQELVLTTEHFEIGPFVGVLLGLIAFVFGLSFLLSLAHRALNGRFHFVQMGRWVLESSIGGIFFLENMFGLRWILGEAFRFTEVYRMLWVAWGLFCLWRLLDLFFDGLRKRNRALILTAIGALAIYVQVVHLIPRKEHRRFPRLDVAPLPISEKLNDPLTPEQAAQKTEQFLRTL